MRDGAWRTGIAVAATVLAVGMRPAGVQGQGQCGCMDIAFVVDDTGSMGPAIDNVKAGIGSIISTAQNVTGGDLRMAVVTFDDQVQVDAPFTTTVTDVQNAVSALSASGGGGEPEASDEALRLVVTGSSNCTVADGLGTFRSGCRRIAILVTDARPGGCDDDFTAGVDDVNAAQVAQSAAQAGILISAVQVLDGSFEAEEAAIMMNYASATGGLFATVPADGSGLDARIVEVIQNCGGARGRIPAPALSWPGLAAAGISLAAMGFWLLGRRTRREGES